MNSSILTPPKLMRQNAFERLDHLQFFINDKKSHRRCFSNNEISDLNYIKITKNTEYLNNVQIKRFKTF